MQETSTSYELMDDDSKAKPIVQDARDVSKVTVFFPGSRKSLRTTSQRPLFQIPVVSYNVSVFKSSAEQGSS